MRKADPNHNDQGPKVPKPRRGKKRNVLVSTRVLRLMIVSILAAVALARASAGDVVINELMYHPPGEREDLQYIELFNRGAETVDLSDGRFEKECGLSLARA
jgi:hypothetical protein